MSNDNSIIAAAQAILTELPKLLPSETAADFDRQIRTLLSEVQSNQTQPTKLLDFLCQSDTTREWIDRYLEGENPMEITRSIQSPAGNPTDVPPPPPDEPPFIGMPSPPTPPAQDA
jgi:hypothetical protein